MRRVPTQREPDGGTTTARSDLAMSSSAHVSTHGQMHSTVEDWSTLSAGSNSLKYKCHYCGTCPAESPYVSNCGHIYCYTCLYYITQGFTAKNKRWTGLLRHRKKSKLAEGGDGGSETWRRKEL